MTSQDFVLYVLKTTILSGIFVGYYWIALRNKRFHYFNRFYLLASLLISLLIPILRFDWFTNEQPVFIGSGESIDFIADATSQASNSMGMADLSIRIMLIITAVMMSMSGYHIYKIYRLKNQSSITKMTGFDMMFTDEPSAPFSFLDNLFWKRSISIDDEGGKQIFKHELTHIQQKHTWDRLFTQLCCSLFWMNPFYWLIQKELETIHEFIADEAAVGNQDIESFAKMLIQTHYGNHFFETKHSFFYSSIKRRLTMLTTTTNTRFSYLRRVMLLPLLLISVSIFSVRIHAKEKIETKINSISEGIFQQKIDTTKPPPLPPMPPNLKELIKTTNKLVLLDGKETSKTEMAEKINPNEIRKYEVVLLNAKEATKKYGDKGKYGAIEISMKFSFVTRKSKETKEYEKVFTIAQEPASFPGGAPSWTKYLERNLNRNIPVNNGAVPGKYRVDLSFIVDKEGSISDVKAENDPGYGTAEEAKRMIAKGPSWIPAKQNGKKVVYLQKQSITFQVTEE